MLGAVLAPWIAPQNPFDAASLNLMDGFTRPGEPSPVTGRVFLLGTDDQGRDVLLGDPLRLARLAAGRLRLGAVLDRARRLARAVAGYLGGRTDALIMRIADIQLSFPAILIALLVFGVARGLIAPAHHEQAAIVVLIVAIGLSNWAQYARTVRGSTLVEKNKDYVMAARVMGRSAFAIMGSHVLPNVIGPVLVIATINLALAIIEEATLSFLGVGVPPTQPSLGTLIRVGQQFLFSGEWWILFFPALDLVLLALSINLLGDWLRDALNPEAAMTEPVLSVRDLTVEFPTRRGTLTAIDGVSFDIAPGEVLGVVGESGAGKSITGAAIIGLIEPPGRIAGGEVLPARRAHRQPAGRSDAQDPRQAHRHGVPGPAHQPQPALPHRRAARRNDHDAYRPVGSRRRARKALALLDEVGIPAPETRIDAYPHQFSGGMRQRVVLALALARRAGAGHRRRADHRARRLGAGADHRAAEAAVPRSTAPPSC